MKINRTWAMPNSSTFQINPIMEFVEKHVEGATVIVDPFAGNSKYGTVTNDLNPEIQTTHHMDALDFLKEVPSESADVVLYDPPYSLRQVVECYKGYGKEVTRETTQSSWRAKHLDEIARILKPGGKALCFGWNSNGVGKKRGFEMDEILLVSHGGSKNDTICTAEIKNADNQPQTLSTAPTIEAEPVRHGHWEEIEIELTWCEDDVDIIYKCSVCGENNIGKSKYCPNCGAKMDDPASDDDFCRKGETK